MSTLLCTHDKVDIDQVFPAYVHVLQVTKDIVEWG